MSNGNVLKKYPSTTEILSDVSGINNKQIQPELNLI